MKNTSEQNTIVALAESKYKLDMLRILLDTYNEGNFEELDSLLEIDNDLDNLMIIRKLELLKYSIKAGVGVDLNIKNPQGLTPLHITASIGYQEVIGILFENNADIEAKDQHGRTPLHIAAARGHTKVAEYLLTIGANINARDDYKNAPIHYAACKGKLETVICLIENGAECNFTLKILPERTIVGYIEFGNLLQSLCSQKIVVIDSAKVEAIKNIFQQTTDADLLLNFAIQNMKNYSPNTVTSNTCFKKIKACTILPENFKDSLLKILQPLTENTAEYVEVIDVESLFIFEQLSESSDYSTIENASKALGELCQQGD